MHSHSLRITSFGCYFPGQMSDLQKMIGRMKDRKIQKFEQVCQEMVTSANPTEGGFLESCRSLGLSAKVAENMVYEYFGMSVSEMTRLLQGRQYGA